MKGYWRATITAVIITALSAPIFAGEFQRVVVFPFETGDKLAEDGTISGEISDYISEVLINRGGYSLISVKELSKEGEKDVAIQAGSAGLIKLMKQYDIDLAIQGTVSMKNKKYLIKGTAVTSDPEAVMSGREVSLSFPRRRYLKNASYSLTGALTEKESDHISDIIEDFNSAIQKREKQLRKENRKYREALAGKKSRAYRELYCRRKSSFIRAGYGSFGMVKTFDDNLNDYYTDGGTCCFADIFLFRLKNTAGNGSDFFVRIHHKSFSMTDKGLESLSGSVTGQNEDDRLGYYSAVPDSPAELVQSGFDLNFRFVDTSYFLSEAWSFYLSWGFRFSWVTEQVVTGGEERINRYFGKGITGGIGLEVSLFTWLGLFCEANIGYLNVSDSDAGMEGPQFLFGVTYRMEPVYEDKVLRWLD